MVVGDLLVRQNRLVHVPQLDWEEGRVDYLPLVELPHRAHPGPLYVDHQVLVLRGKLNEGLLFLVHHKILQNMVVEHIHDEVHRHESQREDKLNPLTIEPFCFKRSKNERETIQFVSDTNCSRYNLCPIQFVPDTICADTICADTNCADTICADTICT